ncbi:MAG: peptide-methionine (S)-S-oxide reductase, partial [Croceibacterium sp.]
MTGWRTALAGGALALGACSSAVAAESTFNAPAAVRVAKEGPGLKTAIFSGGCFWGIEAVFSHIKGVKSAVSGYRGGRAANPSYELVSGGDT